MYLVLNSTDAARALNNSALPDSPVIAELAGAARRDLIADLGQRLSVLGRRLSRRPAPAAAERTHELAA